MNLRILGFSWISITFGGIFVNGFHANNDGNRYDGVHKVAIDEHHHEFDDSFHRIARKFIESDQPNKNAMSASSETVKPGNVDREIMVAADKKNKTDAFQKIVNGKVQSMANSTVEHAMRGKNESEIWNEGRKKKESGVEKEDRGCKMVAEEWVAATKIEASKILQPLCHTRDLEEKFEHLKNSLMNHLSSISDMIVKLEEKFKEERYDMIHDQKRVPGGSEGTYCIENSWTSSKSEANSKNKNGGKSSVSTVINTEGIRDAEIRKFNSSIHVEPGSDDSLKKVFTYYWRIIDMAYKLSGWNPRKSYRSQSFYIYPGGYRMYMRVFPRRNDDTFFVRVGLTRGEFDDSLQWPFSLKHKAQILDQTREGKVLEDIASRVWDPNLHCNDFNWQKPEGGDNQECVEVAFPYDILTQREYIWKDALVIKLTVYLDP